MIVFKSFFKVLKKYKFSLLMYLGISIGLIFILSGFGSKGNTSYYSVSQEIMVRDLDRSEVSAGIIGYLSTINTIKEADDYTEDQIIDMLYYTKISNLLVIPEGFGDSFMKLAKSGDGVSKVLIESTKNSGARMGYSVETEMDSYLNLLSGYIRGGFDLDEAEKLTVDSLSDKSAVKIVADIKIEDDRIFTVFQMLPYGILTMLFSAVLPVILRFGSALLRKRSGISSMPGSKRQSMLALAAGVVSICIVLILIMVASVISGEMFTERWWLIILNLIVLSMTIVMLIVALSNLNIKPEAVAAFTNVIGLSFSFLGGIFVPIEYLGDGARIIGQFLPTYWYSEALTNIKNGEDFSKILICLLIQLLFGVMVMGVGMAAGKYFEKKTA